MAQNENILCFGRLDINVGIALLCLLQFIYDEFNLVMLVFNKKEYGASIIFADGVVVLITLVLIGLCSTPAFALGMKNTKPIWIGLFVVIVDLLASFGIFGISSYALLKYLLEKNWIIEESELDDFYWYSFMAVKCFLYIPLGTWFIMVLWSCRRYIQDQYKSNGDEKTAIELTEVRTDRAVLAVVYSDISLNWNDHRNGTYTRSQAKKDFGNILGGWDKAKASITVDGKDNTLGCRIKILPNSLSEGGFIADADIQHGQEYEVDFDMKFDLKFNWSQGGKVGFGFKIGEGNKTGCRPAWDGNGGSLRLMWHGDKVRVFLRPYVYHYHMPKKCGDDFGKTYPISESENLQKNVWYHVHIYAKSNTGNNKNGWVQILINKTPLINQTIQWTANDKYRKINVLTFNTFRGGNESYWMSPSTDYVYYDNLIVKKIS